MGPELRGETDGGYESAGRARAPAISTAADCKIVGAEAIDAWLPANWAAEAAAAQVPRAERTMTTARRESERAMKRKQRQNKRKDAADTALQDTADI